ncbi:hypothetical protein [Paraflavitalea pollutisoli]|uniref:hypothetical protein n=1 Tax=Paraflavitalea pollutisoli TaxID=3034143 RepID=UPI0023ECFA3C|nr:hypothetical protein [Paraflavitalea sp. H1-2-19X]
MSITKKNAVFFAGGKKVELEINGTTAKGMKLTRNEADGSWNLSLELFISPAEATNVISKFADFKDANGVSIEDPVLHEKLFPNQIYFEAFNPAGQSIDIPFSEGKMLVNQDKEDNDGGSGDIVITLSPLGGVGKTQNIKTQNPIVGPI